mgnify:CR=1 FL=1
MQNSVSFYGARRFKGFVGMFLVSKLRKAISNCDPKIIGKADSITVPEVAGTPVVELSYQAKEPKVIPNRSKILPNTSSMDEMPKSRTK